MDKNPPLRDYKKQMEKERRKQILRKTKKKRSPDKNHSRPRRKDWDQMDFFDPDFYLEETQRMVPLEVAEHKNWLERRVMDNSIKEAEPVDLDIITPKDPDRLNTGKVIEVFSDQCLVLSQEETISCTFSGQLRDEFAVYASPVAVGDLVQFSRETPDKGMILDVLPRTNLLTRTHRPDLGKMVVREKIIAANIDRVLIVQAWKSPAFWPELIDRFLIAAQRNGLEAVLCINKTDLVENWTTFEETILPYRDLGLDILLTSVVDNKGIGKLSELLEHSTTVLAGLSGVGKSSLLTAIYPDLDLKALSVGTRGKNKNQGRHTTTRSTMYQLPAEALVIDTPGIREFGLLKLTKAELQCFYPEIDALRGQCAFADCSHIHEPDCAVKAGVNDGKVSQIRYENYLKIFRGLRE